MNLPPQIVLSDFVPVRRLIGNVTVAEKAVVTTTEDHGYETGYIVRVIVPRVYRMNLYQQTKIIVIDSTSFLTEINTLSQSAFVAPSYPPAFTNAQVVPISGVEDNIAGQI